MRWPWISRALHEALLAVERAHSHGLSRSLNEAQRRIAQLEEDNRQVANAAIAYFDRAASPPPAPASKPHHEQEPKLDLATVDPDDNETLIQIARRETGSVKASTLTSKVRSLRAQIIRAQQRRPAPSIAPVLEEQDGRASVDAMLERVAAEAEAEAQAKVRGA